MFISWDMKNSRKNERIYVIGYKNLRFEQIKEKILKHFHSNFSLLEGNKEISNETIKPSIPITAVEKSCRANSSNVLSFYEYVQKQEMIRESNNYITSSGNPVPSIPSSVKTNARHSKNNSETSQNNFPPSVESCTDHIVIWIILYMIHLILTKPKWKKPNSDELDTYLPISSEELEDVFKSSRKVRTAKWIACASGILEGFGGVPNKYRDKFRISDELIGSGKLGEIDAYECVSPAIITLIKDYRERCLSKWLKDDVTQYSYRIILTMRIRKQEALRFIESNFKKECERLKGENKLTDKVLLKLQRIRERDIGYVRTVENIKQFAWAKRDDFGNRLHTTFTQSPKRLRPFLYFEDYDGQNLILDLANAQPLLMVMTIMEHYQKKKWGEFKLEIDKVPTFLQLLRKYGGNEDVIRYILWVQDGSLYKNMHRLMINHKFKDLKSLYRHCSDYIRMDDPDEVDNQTVIRSIYLLKKPLRQLLDYDKDNEKTKQLLKRLNKIRKQNLSKPSIIDTEFVVNLKDAMKRAYESPMSDEHKRKLKTSLCRHVFYGMLAGQTKKSKKPNQQIAVNAENKRKNPYPVPIKQVFREAFPNVWSVIEYVKRFDYPDLAKELQGREANIFVDNILRKLIVKQGKKHNLSLHDGILTRVEDVDLVKDAIAQAFKRWDIQVPLNIENVSTGETTKVILNKQGDVFKLPYINVIRDGKMIRDYAKVS